MCRSKSATCRRASRVLDVGLNGVLINEDETKRTFMIEALDNVAPVDQEIYVAAKVETRSPLDTSFAAPQAIRLKVKPKTIASLAWSGDCFRNRGSRSGLRAG